MRCPACDDDTADLRVCASCGRARVPGDGRVPARASTVDAYLGRFHPAMALRVTDLLDRRGVAYEASQSGDSVEIVVSRSWRDDLRAELSTNWPELIARLDPVVAADLLAAGGPAPGWVDAPQGGHVDRLGRLVVEPSDVDEAAADAARLLGPSLLTVGAIAVIAGWYLLDSPALMLIGIGLVLIGVLTPR